MATLTFQPGKDCASVRALLEVHALGALPPHEADRIEEHILNCRECDAHFQSFTDFLPLLGMAAPPLAPSTAVRTSLLATARSEHASHQPAARPRLRQRIRQVPATIQRLRLPAVFSVPTIGLILILGALTLGSQYQLGHQRDRVQMLEQQNAGLSTHLESIRVGKVTYGSNVRVYAFQASQVDSHSAGLLLTGPDRKSVLISLWSFVPSGSPLRVVFGSAEHGDVVLGTVMVDASGVGSVQVMLPDVIDSFDSVRIVEDLGDATETNAESATELLFLDVHAQILDDATVD
jgi:hypothetical protein